MKEHFNGLSPAQAERIALLAEEASEVVKACMKILRHGYASYNPNLTNGKSNAFLLAEEMADYEYAKELVLNKDMDHTKQHIERQLEARRKRDNYFHHQG